MGDGTRNGHHSRGTRPVVKAIIMTEELRNVASLDPKGRGVWIPLDPSPSYAGGGGRVVILPSVGVTSGEATVGVSSERSEKEDLVPTNSLADLVLYRSRDERHHGRGPERRGKGRTPRN